MIHIILMATGDIFVLSPNFRCSCGFGYKDSPDSTAGMKCVQKCNTQSCDFFEVCTDGRADKPEVSCTCPSGFSGSKCSIRQSPLSRDAVIVVSLMVVLAALTGVALCSYSGYRLFCRKSEWSEVESESSISSYKPKTMPVDYRQFTDSYSRGAALNRAYANTIHEESEPETVDVQVANDGLTFGARNLQARLDTNDATYDPTPILTPVARTERHVYSDVESQPDYF